MAERDRQAHTRIVNPGPIDTSVLVLQDRHISQRVWNRLENSVSFHGYLVYLVATFLV